MSQARYARDDRRPSFPRIQFSLGTFPANEWIVKVVQITDEARTMRCGGDMSKSRREFLADTSIVLLSAAGVLHLEGQAAGNSRQQGGAAAAPPPGMPSAFGTAPPVGPEVSAATIAEAQKLVQVEM